MAISSPFFCDSCGAANRPQAVFCFACGQPLQAHAGKGSSQTTGLLAYKHLLKQRYRIISQVGKGGFGAVYKAADLQFGNRQVAIKEMSQSSLSQQELIEATEIVQTRGTAARRTDTSQPAAYLRAIYRCRTLVSCNGLYRGRNSRRAPWQDQGW